MSDIEFGDDDGREDQFNTPLDPDPEQVTIRYHDERVLFGAVNLGMWHDLDEDNRAIARVIGYALLTRLLAGDNAEAANSFINRLREYLEPGAELLDERPILEALIRAMENEGTLSA